MAVKPTPPRWRQTVAGAPPFRRRIWRLFYPASPVEIVVSLCLTFSVSVVFFVGAIVGWISVSYYSRITCLNESSEISEETYNERKKK
nr:conjugal transfer protein TrbJ [Escherichia coli]